MSGIRFMCEEGLLGVLPEPIQAIKKAPHYYRSIKPQTDVSPSSGTVKRCVPFLDALSAGYIIPLWCDVFVSAHNGEMKVEFPNSLPMAKSLETHGYQQAPGHPLSETPYGKTFMKFINPWVVETDPGYSCLFTSPLNHMETRLKILDGVVDTDTYYNNINFPFLWTGGDGDFVIDKGTPLVQVIPFKREEFSLSVSAVDAAKRGKVQATIGTHLKNGYRKNYWSGRSQDGGGEE